MGHGSPLTARELDEFTLPGELVRYLEAYRAERGLDPARLRVLDWGCGRGLFVAALRALGYDAYGVDVDQGTMHNGLALMSARGVLDGQALQLLDGAGRAPWPDGHFDFVCSWYVFEHVAALAPVAGEIRRLSAPGAGGFHVFPGPLRPFEGHLDMPIVHWLPKGGARRAAIHLFTRLGVEPRWPYVAGRSRGEKAEAYYEYSVRRTFYYRWAEIEAVFRANGLTPRCVSLAHPRIGGRPLIGRLLARPATRALAGAMVRTFKTVEFVTRAAPRGEGAGV